MKNILSIIGLFAVFLVNGQAKISNGLPDTSGVNKGRVMYTVDFYNFIAPYVNGGSAYVSSNNQQIQSLGLQIGTLSNSTATSIYNLQQQHFIDSIYNKQQRDLQSVGIAAKPDTGSVYTRSAVDGLLFGKANTSTVAGNTNSINALQGNYSGFLSRYAADSANRDAQIAARVTTATYTSGLAGKLDATSTAITTVLGYNPVSPTQLSSATSPLLSSAAAATIYYPLSGNPTGFALASGVPTMAQFTALKNTNDSLRLAVVAKQDSITRLTNQVISLSATNGTLPTYNYSISLSTGVLSYNVPLSLGYKPSNILVQNTKALVATGASVDAITATYFTVTLVSIPAAILTAGTMAVTYNPVK